MPESALKSWATRRAKCNGSDVSRAVRVSSAPFPTAEDSDESIYTLSANGLSLGHARLSTEQASHLNLMFKARRLVYSWAAL